MDWEGYFEEEETEDWDDTGPFSGLDEHGLPDAEMFNAAMTEASEYVDPNEFADENSPDEYPEDHGAAFETLPEMDIIEHNIGV